MNNWINAIVLLWALAWRILLGSSVILLVAGIFTTIGEQYIFTGEQDFQLLSDGSGNIEYSVISVTALLSLFMVLISEIWLPGWCGKHAINHCFGKRKISLSINGKAKDLAAWTDGFILYWAFLWRFFILSTIWIFILATISAGRQESIPDGTIVLIYYYFEILLLVMFSVISSYHLLRKPLGARTYRIVTAHKESTA